jgi:prophage regulatory protein
MPAATSANEATEVAIGTGDGSSRAKRFINEGGRLGKKQSYDGTSHRPPIQGTSVPGHRILRLKSIIGPDGLLPIGRSTFYSWIKSGRVKAPVKLGRISVWHEADILQIVKNGVAPER